MNMFLMAAALSMHLGYVDRVDNSLTAQPPAYEVGLEYQEKYWSGGVKTSVGDETEAFVYVGPSYTFSLNKFEVRPLVGVGLMYESEPNSWRTGDNFGFRLVGQIEGRYRLSDTTAVGLYVSKTSNLEDDRLSKGFDDAGSGVSYGLSLTKSF